MTAAPGGSTNFLLLVTLAITACRPSTERRRVDFERMREQQRADAYGSSAVFANGMVMRVPPSGAISREEFRLGEGVATGKLRGAYVTHIPLTLTTAQLRVGERDFRIYCGVCHGSDGSGRSIMASNLREHAPPSLLSDAVRGLTAGRMFDVITQGFGHMPAYGWALPAEERWAVIAYVRSLQGPRQ